MHKARLSKIGKTGGKFSKLLQSDNLLWYCRSPTLEGDWHKHSHVLGPPPHISELKSSQTFIFQKRCNCWARTSGWGPAARTLEDGSSIRTQRFLQAKLHLRAIAQFVMTKQRIYPCPPSASLSTPPTSAHRLFWSLFQEARWYLAVWFLCTFLRFDWLGGGGGGGMLTFLELAHTTHALFLPAEALHATPMLTFLELAPTTDAVFLRSTWPEFSNKSGKGARWMKKSSLTSTLGCGATTCPPGQTSKKELAKMCWQSSSPAVSKKRSRKQHMWKHHSSEFKPSQNKARRPRHFNQRVTLFHVPLFGQGKK